MNRDTVLKIVLSIVGSVGGAGAFIALAVKFSANLIADKLKKKYELETTKKLEEYKSKLEIKITSVKQGLIQSLAFIERYQLRFLIW